MKIRWRTTLEERKNPQTRFQYQFVDLSDESSIFKVDFDLGLRGVPKREKRENFKR
jgi:hypothetical protein